jgi:6-phosphogluconolactonase (cycloisomerase 2 family)
MNTLALRSHHVPFALLGLFAVAGCGKHGGSSASGVAPTNLSYERTFALYAKDVAIAPNAPTVTGNVTKWTIQPPLPNGLVLNPSTGVITGSANVIAAEGDYTVKAANPFGSTTASVHIGVVRPSLLAIAGNFLDNTLSTFAVDAATGSLRPTGYMVPTHCEVSPRGITTLPSGRFAYMLNSIANDITTYSIDAVNGRIEALPGTVPVAGGAPNEMILHPTADIAYVIQRYSPNIETFAIDMTSGALTSLGSLAAGTAAETAVIDREGRAMYVANSGNNTISTFALDETTYLPTAIGAPIATSGVPISMVLSEHNDFLYVVSLDGNALDVFAVAQDGSLSAAGSLATGWLPTRVAIDPQGRFLYVAVSSDDTIRTLALDPLSGMPSEVSAVAAGMRPGTLMFDGTAERLYVGELDQGEIEIFSVDQVTGALTHQESVRTRQQPLYFTIVPGEERAQAHARFAYVVNSASQNVSAYKPGAANGELGQVAPNLPVASSPRNIVVDARSRFAYVAHGSTNEVRAYAIAPLTGELSEVGTPQLAGTTPVSLSIDPSGRFLFAANADSNDVTTFAIDATTGLLNATSTAPVGASPQVIVCEPSGRFAYVANAGSSSISVMKINLANGALTAGLALSPSLGASSSLTPHPSGRYLLSSFAQSGRVGAFFIDALTGELDELANIPSGSEPTCVALDPFGRFAYVTNHDAGNVGDVSMFAVDAGSGALSDLGHVPAGTNPVVAAVEPSGRFLYVVNQTSDNVSVFAIDAASGTLTLRSQSAAGVEPMAIAIAGTQF